MTQAANNSPICPAGLRLPAGVTGANASAAGGPEPAASAPTGGAAPLADAFVASGASGGAGLFDLQGAGDSWQVSGLAEVLAKFQSAPAAPAAASPVALPSPTPRVDVPLSTPPSAAPSVANVPQAPIMPSPAVTPSPAPGPVVAPRVAIAAAYQPLSSAAAVLPSILNATNESAAFSAAIEELNKALEERHRAPQNYQPATDPAADAAVGAKLKDLQAAELTRLGQDDKKAFFAALRPAAEEAERQYGVPAAITLAQAALETGWGKHIIPGFNIFGIKGKGPAGTVRKGTWEVYGGEKVTITANFAQYHNFYEAIVEHGKLFHNGYYDKAMNQYAKDHDPVAFAKNITGVYATDPSYGNKLTSIMRQYQLI